METKNQKEEKSSERLSAVVRSLQANTKTFRLWDLEKKQMYYGIDVFAWRSPKNYKDFYIITQMIDIQDYKGRNLYEGDYIEVKQATFVEKGVIMYNEIMAGYTIGNKMSLHHVLNVNNSYKITLLGNIFENTELLE